MRQTAMRAVYELAKRDERVLFIGSDLGVGVLDDMKKNMPERFFMEGVAEQHIIGMSAGLAMDGYIPYINTIATFLTRRCYEQVAVDLAQPKLPVRLIASGGGVVYAPLGPTHLAVEDMAIMRALPNMTVVAPVDAPEMQRLMDASLSWPGPMYIRVAKGGDPVVSEERHGFAIGRSILMREPGDVLLIGTGIMTTRALDSAAQLEEHGISCGVLHVHTVKPLDEERILDLARNVRLIVTAEEHTRIGGLGSAVAELLVDRDIRTPLVRLGLADHFINDYGSQDSVLATAGLDAAGLTSTIRQRLVQA